MPFKQSKPKKEKKEPKSLVYRKFLDSERAEYMAKLVKKYPKHPVPLLEMILTVWEKEQFGTDEEKQAIKHYMGTIGDKPDLNYFGKNGFQEEIVENKGFTVKQINEVVQKVKAD